MERSILCRMMYDRNKKYVTVSVSEGGWVQIPACTMDVFYEQPLFVTPKVLEANPRFFSVQRSF